MIWLLILLPSVVMICCLGVVWASELAHRRVRRYRRG